MWLEHVPHCLDAGNRALFFGTEGIMAGLLFAKALKETCKITTYVFWPNRKVWGV